MGETKIYKKRIIPDETLLLKDDEIIMRNDDVLITKWNTIKPRKDFKRGYSCCFLKEGFKVSKFINDKDELIYFYCDIMKMNYNKDKDEYIFLDMLADVKIYPDKKVEVLDLDEISEALTNELINDDDVCYILNTLHKLLDIIYKGEFTNFIEDYLIYE